MTKKFSILFLFAMVATYGTFYIADNVNRQPASTPIDASTKPVDLSNQPAAKKSFLAAHYTVPDMTTYHQQESFKYAVRSKELNDRLIQAQNDLSKINVNTNPKNQLAYKKGHANVRALQYQLSTLNNRVSGNTNMFFINQMIQYRVARGKREWLQERSLKLKAELKTKKAELEKAKGPEDATKIQKEIAVLEERISSVIANAKDYQKRERFYQTALFNLIYTGYPAGLGGSPLPTLAALQQKPPVPGDANFVGPTQPSVIGRHEGPVSEVYIPPAGYLTPASR